RLTRREDELRQELGAELEPPPQLSGVEWGPYRRGLINTIRVDTADRFLEHAQAIFVAAPITDGWVTALDAAGAAQLAASEIVLRIALLKNHGTPVGDEGIAALADSRHAVNLRRLFLNGNQIGDDGARALARSRSLGRLVTLFLHNNRIGDAGARALAK